MGDVGRRRRAVVTAAGTVVAFVLTACAALDQEGSGVGPPASADPGEEQWRTVEHERVLVDVPADWQRLDMTACGPDARLLRLGPSGASACDGFRGASVYGSALWDACCGPGEGYTYAGDQVVNVEVRDDEVARRVLASFRTPADAALSIGRGWSQVERRGVVVDVPRSVDVEVTSPEQVRAWGGTRPAVPRGAEWRAESHEARLPAPVVVVAPTQALADVVLASARPAPG